MEYLAKREEWRCAIITCVIPSRTDEYFDACLTAMEASEEGSSASVIVADNGLSPACRERWPLVAFMDYTKRHGPFVFAKAINMCAEATGRDLLVLNDDTRMVTPHWYTKLRVALVQEKAQPFGMLSLAIDGGVGNPEQRKGEYPPGYILHAYHTLCFVATVVRREVIEKVGLLDERFVDYGFDDDDYCRRVVQAGWKLGVLNAVTVQHGWGPRGLPHSASYARYNTHQEWNDKTQANRRRFVEKWGGQQDAPTQPVKAVEQEVVKVTTEKHDPYREVGMAVVSRPRALNIGCGDRPRAAEDVRWENLDQSERVGVDVVRDIRRGLPFEDESFDHVLMDNVLEHLVSEDAIFVLNEIGRVLRPGGTAEIIVPHANSQGAHQDPTHRSYWVPRSVIYWNQSMSAYGGCFVGIPANLMPVGEPEVYGDMNTEAFIRFKVRKDPL